MKLGWYMGIFSLCLLVAWVGYSRPDFEMKYHPTLPNPLRVGNKIFSASEWEAHRPYLKHVLTRYQYGEMPDHRSVDRVAVETIDDTYTLDSTAQQKTLRFTLYKGGKQASFRVGAVIPQPEDSYPVEPLPVIIKNDRFLFNLGDMQNPEKEAQYRKKGRDKVQQFAASQAVERGYVFVKFIRDDVAPDRSDNQDTGVLALYPEYSWGNTAAWAWAYSFIIDWLEKQPYVDADKIAVTGHSRGGKTALCAGIYDERIAVTAPNSSGSGGTGSWRYFDPKQKPQTLTVAEERHYYWFTDSLFRFVDSVAYLPFDAHFAKMLIAPRALVNLHARHDYWANPYGTQLTHLAAQPIFDAYGKSDNLALHWRDGGHNQGQEDWLALYDFCDWYFYGKPRTNDYNQNPHAHYKYDSILDPYFEYFKGFGKITTQP